LLFRGFSVLVTTFALLLTVRAQAVHHIRVKACINFPTHPLVAQVMHITTRVTPASPTLSIMLPGLANTAPEQVVLISVTKAAQVVYWLRQASVFRRASQQVASLLIWTSV